MAVLVVGGTLLAIGQDFIRGLDLLELFFGVLAVRITVRVVLHRQLAIGLLDVVVRRIAIDAQYLVKVLFSHAVSPVRPTAKVGRKFYQ
ncbi:hypothetical protein D3C78_1776390 [compost metagenome]